MFKNILIEAGHGKSSDGGNDNGASFEGLIERELTVTITSRLRTLLTENDISFNSFGIFTRQTLTTKVNNINEHNALNLNKDSDTLLLSIHINAGGGHGLETFTYKKWSKGLEYGEIIIDNIIKQTGQTSRGAKYENESHLDKLAIVHDTIGCTSILVECGFIEAGYDRNIFQNRIDSLVLGLYNGLAELCGFEKLEALAPVESYEGEIEKLEKIIKERDIRLNEVITKNKALEDTNNYLEAKIEAAQEVLA